MKKTEWSAPKLEMLSTRKTAAGGEAALDNFHTALSADDSQPSGELPGQS